MQADAYKCLLSDPSRLFVDTSNGNDIKQRKGALLLKQQLYSYTKQKHLGCKKSARPIRSSIANRCDQKL